jgi:hypothetical protein
VHCSALGTRCRIHYAGAAALLLAALLLIVSAVFEGVYASLHPGGWGESVHALAAELGGDAPKMKKRKSHLSISEPFHPREKDSTDGAPLMHAPAPCATLPLTYNGYGMELDPLDFRPTPAPPSPARAESSLGPPFPKSPSAGSVSTLATTPLFGLAPAYVTPGQRTSSLSPELSPTPSQNAGTFGRKASKGSNPYSTTTENPYRTPSRVSHEAPEANPYRSPSQRSNTHASPRENPYKLRPLPGVEERPKLSMEQIDRKRTLFAEGRL